MKKVLALILSALMIVTLAACNPTNPTQGTEPETTKTTEEATTQPTEKDTEAPTEEKEPIVITFWDENGTDQRTPHYMEMIKRFEAENPDIKIDYLGLVLAEANAKYLTAIETGTTPDVGGIGTSFETTLIAQGHLVDLMPYCEKWDEFQYQNPNIIKMMHKHSGGDDVLYELPRSANVTTYWYNKTQFEKRNLEVPDTWSEFFDSLPLLNDPDNETYAFSLLGGSYGSSSIWGYIWDYLGSTELIGEDGYTTCNQPGAVEFAQKFIDIYDVYTPTSDITNDYIKMTAEFDSGAALSFFHNLGSYPDHMQTFPDRGEEFGAAHLPKSDINGKVIGFYSSLGTGMFDTCPEEKREAAFKWIAYLAGHDGCSYFNSKIGQLPTNALVAQDDWVSEMDHIQMAMETTNSDYYEETDNLTYLPGWGSVMSTKSDPLYQEALSHKITAQEFLDQWKVWIDELIDEYNAP